MEFKEFIEKLENGATVEELAKGTNVECIGNVVYEDDDLYEFLEDMGAEISEYGVDYAVIRTDEDEYYEVPYEANANRFNPNLSEETVLYFEPNKIYDVTDNYISVVETDDED